MKRSNSSTASSNISETLQLARTRVTTAEASVETARRESRVAKRKRKEAREAVGRAKKRLRRAKDELAEARCVLADAEEKLVRQARRAASRGKRLMAHPATKPHASKSAKKMTHQAKTQASEPPPAETLLPVQPLVPIASELLPETPIVTEEAPFPSEAGSAGQ